MRIEPDRSGVAIVLVGSFNPAIFSPAWFVMHDLLPKKAAEAAEVGVVHPEVTRFSTDWLQLEANNSQLQLHTAASPYVRLCDLTVRMFREHLPHTPIAAVGINRHVHFRLRDMSERDYLGRTLVPVAPWGEWGKALGDDGEHGGPTSVTMTQVSPDGRPTGDRINVTVEPSQHVGGGRTGVYVRVNDHYVTVAAGEAPPSAYKAVEVLEDRFESSLSLSDDIIDHLMSLREVRA